jgi:hypothetical protein
MYAKTWYKYRAFIILSVRWTTRTSPFVPPARSACHILVPIPGFPTLIVFMGAGPASLSQLLLPIGFRSGVIYSWLFKYTQQHLTLMLSFIFVSDFYWVKANMWRFLYPLPLGSHKQVQWPDWMTYTMCSVLIKWYLQLSMYSVLIGWYIQCTVFWLDDIYNVQCSDWMIPYCWYTMADYNHFISISIDG